MLEPYEYKEYLDSYAWKALKKSKLRDNPQCEICWIKAMTVHHLSYTRLWKEKETDIVSICDSCHYKCHFDEWEKIPINTRSLTKRFNILKEEKVSNESLSKFNNGIDDFDKDYESYHDNGNNDYIEIIVIIIFVWLFFINKISKSWLLLTLTQILFWLIYIFLVTVIIPKIYINITKSEKTDWTFVWFYLIICLFISFYLFEYIFKTSPF